MTQIPEEIYDTHLPKRMKLSGEALLAQVTQGTKGSAGGGVGNNVVLTTHRLVVFSGSSDNWMSVPLENIILVERHRNRLVFKLPDQHEIIINCQDGVTAQLFSNEVLHTRSKMLEIRGGAR